MGKLLSVKFEVYLQQLSSKKKLSAVKLQILQILWSGDEVSFPKPWVSSAELLELTGQKYFDRRARELRDQMGCDLESAYHEPFLGYAWRIRSAQLMFAQDRAYLTIAQKIKLFQQYHYTCVICGTQIDAGIKGLQADHKIPLSRGGGNQLENWQPLCNHCNVGKRRACEGCTIDCHTCAWAFPEQVGIKVILAINERILQRLDSYCLNTGQTRTQVIAEAITQYLSIKEKAR